MGHPPIGNPQQYRAPAKNNAVPNRRGEQNTMQPPVFRDHDARSHAWDQNGRRYGFDPHRPGFTIDQFNFHHYAERPDRGAYVSPWYFYNNVPGYLSIEFTFSASPVRFAWEVGDPYRWEWHHHEFGQEQALDNTIDRIEDCFVHQSVSEMTPLLPSGSRVQIDEEGQSRYALGAADFQNMLGDVIYSTTTISYSVVDVWRNGNTATVVAEHEYRDQDGNTRLQRHWYGLRSNGSFFKITDFRTENI